MSKKKYGLAAGLILGALGVISFVVLYERPDRQYEESPFQQKVEEETTQLKAERARLDKEVWSVEVAAQKHEDRFVSLWDDLRRSTNKIDVLKLFPFQSLKISQLHQAGHHPPDIAILKPSEESPLDLNHEAFANWAQKFQEQGFEIVQTEWHHQAFDQGTKESSKSLISMTLHVRKAGTTERFIVNGKLKVLWDPAHETETLPVPLSLDLTDLTVYTRQGPAVFKEITGAEGPAGIVPMGNDTILTYDLNRDGLPEILIPEHNLALWNQGEGRFERRPLIDKPLFDPEDNTMEVGSAILADLNEDGWPDLVLAGNRIRVVVYDGDANGHFQGEPRKIFDPIGVLNFPSVITAGDVNGDGHLDLFIAQIKPAYDMGSMPTPYYDANDGFPSNLLLNQGDGTFKEVTEEAGLGKKRYRRTFSSSLVDLDNDNDLDLLVVSDFAGLDVYENDGKGNFTDVTKTAVDETANFGMGHTFADFDRDGIIDFYVTGMSSTTVRRLEYMGLKRTDRPEIHETRMKMAYGNRMYVSDKKMQYHHPAFNDQVARSGWSWGTAAIDITNDGFQDIYIANGNMSGKSCKDYCTRYWTQDIYMGNSAPNAALSRLFSEIAEETRDYSWNGFEKNVLFLNDGGTNYINGSFLMDVAFVYDSRSVIAIDMNLDGRQDLIVLEKEPVAGIVAGLASNTAAQASQGQMHIYLNEWESNNRWVGIRLQDEPGLSPIGAKIRLTTEKGTRIAHLITGDSFNCQHDTVKVFGLGQDQDLKEISIQWMDGTVKTLTNPEANRYHLVLARDQP